MAGSPHAAQQSLESELVTIFSDLAELFGNPRSHGAMYGLLFASEIPLSMDDIIRRLGISKGSASQGLRHLEEFGAVTREKENGTRTHLYAARLELRPLIAGFLSKRLLPGLTGGAERLKKLRDLVPDLPPAAQRTASLRLERIEKWHTRAVTFLPLAKKFLQTG